MARELVHVLPHEVPEGEQQLRGPRDAVVRPGCEVELPQRPFFCSLHLKARGEVGGLGVINYWRITESKPSTYPLTIMLAALTLTFLTVKSLIVQSSRTISDVDVTVILLKCLVPEGQYSSHFT